MEDELYDANSFSFDLPIWAIDKDGFIVSAAVGRYGRCLLLFTDEYLATTAIEEFELAGATLQEIGDAEMLALILKNVKNAGDEYVGLDLSVKRSRGVFETIETLLKQLP